MTDASKNLLREFLALSGRPCPICGYSLVNLESDRCPECGASLELRVASADLRLGSWLLGVIGASVGLGFSIMLSIPVGLALAFSELSGREWVVITVHTVSTLLVAGILILVVRTRRRFWIRPRRAQRAIGILIASVSLLLPAGSLLFMLMG